MKKIFRITSALFLALVFTALSASAQSPVHWKATVKMTSSTTGVITVVGTIDPGWHVYSFTQPEDGPQAMTVAMSATKGVKFTDKLSYKPTPKSVMEEMFGAKVSFWENKVTFTRKFKITKVKTGTATIKISYMCCNDSSCRPPVTDTLTVKLK